MTSAAFVFFYLVAAILATHNPVIFLWGVGLYSAWVVRNIWSSW
mgnify:CR=1 FL=1